MHAKTKFHKSMDQLRQRGAVRRGEAALLEFAEVGQRYLSRNGEVFTVIRTDSLLSTDHPIELQREDEGIAAVDRFGHFLSSDEESGYDMVEWLLDADEPEAAKPEAKIEPQVLLCHCCSAAQNMRVEHEDPCIYTADERGMKPAIKAMFRAERLKRREALGAALTRTAELQELAHIETMCMFDSVDNPGMRRLTVDGDEPYERLTGCAVKASKK